MYICIHVIYIIKKYKFKFIFILIYMFIFTVILRTVARDMLYVTRIIGGFVQVLFSTNSQTFPVSPSISLFSLSLFSLFMCISFHLCLSSRLFHLFFSSLCFCALACSVLCCCVLLCVLVLCVCVCACLCVSLCHVSGVEQCVQVKRINGGLGNVLFSTFSQTENR